MSILHESSLKSDDALVLTDIQNDFLPGGALEILNADQVIPPLNQLIGAFEKSRLPIIATRDWHPENHCSFKEQGGPWKKHCVQDTPGALFSEKLRFPSRAVVISKATQANKEAYSAFSDTSLHETLLAKGVKRIFIGGLATDFCVYFTTKDALKLGYQVVILKDAVRGIDLHPGDSEKALNELQTLGATLSTTGQVLAAQEAA